MVQLKPLSEEQLQTYLEGAIRSYAEEHIKGGRWTTENALENSRKEFEALLPQGTQTPNQYLYSIYDEENGEHVGILWFARQQREGVWTAFVYEIEVFEPYRRRGYGSRAFVLMEEKVRELDLSTIGLHVFGHNHGAVKMYEKLGYVATNIMMRKTLD